MTSQGDRDALIDAMAKALHDEQFVKDAGDGYPSIRMLPEAEAAQVMLDALLPLWPAFLRVALATRKPCETCNGKGFVNRPGWRCGCGAHVRHMRDCGRPAPHDKCPTCRGSGSVPLVDREQVLAALGMEQVGWRGDGVEFTTRPNVANARRMWAERVPVPEPSEGPPKLPADHSLCDLPCDLPAEAHDG